MKMNNKNKTISKQQLFDSIRLPMAKPTIQHIDKKHKKPKYKQKLLKDEGE